VGVSGWWWCWRWDLAQRSILCKVRRGLSRNFGFFSPVTFYAGPHRWPIRLAAAGVPAKTACRSVDTGLLEWTLPTIRHDTTPTLSTPGLHLESPSPRFHVPAMAHGAMDAKVTSGRTAGLYAGAAVLRLAIFTLLPALPDLLTGRVEISTPVTSFKRCKLPQAACLLFADPFQCRKASFCTTTMSRPTTAASTTRRPFSSRSSRCSRASRPSRSLPTSSTSPWIC
jgi:hypothetical protein